MTVRSKVFRTPEASLSFPQDLFEGRDIGNGRTSYGCVLIMSEEDRSAVEDEVDKVATEAFGEEAVDELMTGEIRSPLLAGDGDQARDANGALRPGMGRGRFFVRATSLYQPSFFVREADGSLRRLSVDEARDVLTMGARVVAGVNAHSWGGGDKRGVGIGLSMILFVREGVLESEEDALAEEVFG